MDILKLANKHCVSKWNKCPRGGMVDTRHLKCLASRRAGSSPAAGTKNKTPLAQLVRAERS
jgi:hypothetical protein